MDEIIVISVSRKTRPSETLLRRLMAALGVLFCCLPTIIVFFILQKQFAEGITGSVK